jgi:hypothetical protein
MNDRELETRLRAMYHAEVNQSELVPDSLRRDVAAIARTGSAPRRLFGRGRGLTLLAAAAAVTLVGGALIAGSGVLRRTSVVPPTTAPSHGPLAIASAEVPSPRPSDSPPASPAALSLDLTWTRIPLTEHRPRLAWIGDRFVLADAASGAVRTSTDGATWQAMAGDAASGYVDLVSGPIASWQDQVVGWLNPEDGPDTPTPPASHRHVVTIVRPPAPPVSSVPFKGQIAAIGVGPRGFVAETHSALDFEHWVTKKLGLRTNNDWTMHVKSISFRNGVLEIKLHNRPGLRVVWADQGYEPGDLEDGGFGWYSPDGEHWTEMAPKDNSGSDFGSTLPTGGYGAVVGVSDGFIATGACAPDGCNGTGIWYSADGLTWHLLGSDQAGDDLRPWMGGALVGGADVWTSSGSSRLPIAGDLPRTQLPFSVGPLGLVSVSMEDQKVFVSRDGVHSGVSPIPPEMMSAFHGRLWAQYAPEVVVGDKTVLDLEWWDDGNNPPTPSLWLGTFQP